MTAAPGAIVVGTGFGCWTHLRALRAAGYRVDALVGRDAREDEIPCRAFRGPRRDDLVRRGAGPAGRGGGVGRDPAAHPRRPGLEAVAAGKHVVCEKPFARDAAEARQMLAAAEAAGVVHLLGTEFRFATSQALVARLIAEGAIGEPRLARLTGGSFAGCASTRATQHALSTRAIRLLRAKVTGHFRTRGRYSSATVRGTQWETLDRCDATETSVTQGVVVVHDFRTGADTVVAAAGQSYVAKPTAPRRRRPRRARRG